MPDREHLAKIIDEGMAGRGNDVRKWPEDEAAAYRVDGWAEGRARARAIQVSKTVDALLVALSTHPTDLHTSHEFGGPVMGEAEKVIDAAIQEWDQMALSTKPVYVPLATHIVSALYAAGLLAPESTVSNHTDGGE